MVVIVIWRYVDMKRAIGLVVKYLVAIEMPRVQFPDGAYLLPQVFSVPFSYWWVSTNLRHVILSRLSFRTFFTIFSILLFFFNVDTVRERLASMRQTFRQPVKYCGHAQVDSSSVLYRLIADGHARNTARQHNLHLLREQTFVFI